jgi:hypothetical protein
MFVQMLSTGVKAEERMTCLHKQASLTGRTALDTCALALCEADAHMSSLFQQESDLVSGNAPS